MYEWIQSVHKIKRKANNNKESSAKHKSRYKEAKRLKLRKGTDDYYVTDKARLKSGFRRKRIENTNQVALTLNLSKHLENNTNFKATN